MLNDIVIPVLKRYHQSVEWLRLDLDQHNPQTNPPITVEIIEWPNLDYSNNETRCRNNKQFARKS